MQAQAQAQANQKIQQQVFRFCAWSAILLPFIVVLGPPLLGLYHPWSTLVGALGSTVGSAINYAVYLRRKNLRIACIAHVAIANLCFGIVILATGGTASHLVVFAPLIVVIAGLLSGRYAAITTAIFLSCELLHVETYLKLSTITPPSTQSFEVTFLEIFCCLVTIAGVVSLHENMREKNEASLTEMNAALIKEKLQSDQIMHALDESAIVTITDVSGKITWVNDNFCKISGYTADELVGQNHRLINSGRHSKKFFADLWRTIGSDKVWTGEIENRSKDGRSYVVQTVITPLANQDGTIEKYLSVRFEVTKEKEASRQLEEAQRVAKIGSWSFDVASGNSYWSKQMLVLHDENPALPPPNIHQHLEFIYPDDRAYWQDQASECLRSGKPFRIRFRIVTKTQRVVWLESIAEAVQDAHGNVIKARGTSQDVSDLVTAEELIKSKQNELRARQRFLDTVLANIPSMIFVKDYRNELRFSLLNKASERILGISAESMLGKCDYDFFSKEQAESFTQKDKEVFVKGAAFKIPSEPINTPHGQRLLFTVKIPTYDEQGLPEFLIGISNDITDEVRTREQLESERAKVIQTSKLASLGEMSAGIAHEINNPLTIIAGTVRALPKFAANPAEFHERMQTIHKSIERIEKIVSGLRKFSRTAGGSEMKPHSICDIVKEALVLTSAKSGRHCVPIELDASSKQRILCDEIEIEQVLVNLINNGIDAVKHRQENWVKLRVFDDGQEVVLEVSDSGPGISGETRDKLFQPFFTTKPVGEGTGLGLAIVKGILDEHNATIAIRADAPTTCFVIRFRKTEEAKHVA